MRPAASLSICALALFGCGESAPERSAALRSFLGPGTIAAAEDAGFRKADAPVDFAFPRDHGPHLDFRTEWWYLTAVLADAAGREFGIQFTLFRLGIEPVSAVDGDVEGAAGWRTGQVYMAHAAVSDVAERRHYEAERLVRGHPALAGVRAAPFEAHLEGWRLAARAAETLLPAQLAVATSDFEISLTLSGGRTPVLQGDQGLSHKGEGNASYYYSIPRIDVHGQLAVKGQRHAVRGQAWLDREWSTSLLAPEYDGWDWFGLHLADGRDLMLFRLRRNDGRPDDYSAQGIALAATDRWRGWPITWDLTLGEGAGAERLRIRAAFEDQVMDTSVRYWEGVVHVQDSAGQRIGDGYMELTGY